MSVEAALDITTLIWAIAAIPALSIAAAQLILLIQMRNRQDRLWRFRVMGALLFGSLGVAMARNVAVWADVAFFDQRYLGPIAVRWPLDLAIATLIMLACCLAGWLYVDEQRRTP